MYYKQIDSCNKLIAIGTTVDGAILPKNFIQISKKEYTSLKKILDMTLEDVALTPLNEDGELLLN